MFSFIFLALLVVSVHSETFVVDIFQDIDIELFLSNIASQVGIFGFGTEITVTSVVGDSIPFFTEGGVFTLDNIEFFNIKGLEPGRNATVSFSYNEAANIGNGNTVTPRNFEIIFQGVELFVEQETFLITECNCEDKIFPNFSGHLITNISTGANDFQCASETHGILPTLPSENELEFLFPSEIFRSSLNPEVDSSWVGMIQFETLVDFSSLTVDDLIEFEVAGSDNNLLFGFELGRPSLTNKGEKKLNTPNISPLDDRAVSPVLIFGNLLLAELGGGLFGGDAFTIFSTLFADSVFDEPFPRFAENTGFSAPGNLTGNVKIKVQENIIFQGIKFFKLGAENGEFVRIFFNDLSFELIRLSPELRGRLLPNIEETVKLIIAEEVLPLDLNPKVFFPLDDDFDFKNASFEENILEVSNFELTRIFPSFLQGGNLRFNFGDDFVSCFSEANVSLKFADAADLEINRLTIDLEQITSAQFELNLTTASTAAFVSKPSNDFTLFFGDCLSQDVIESGRKIEIEDEAIFQFCVKIKGNQSVSEKFIIYSAQNGTVVNNYQIIEVNSELLEEDVEQQNEEMEYNDLLLVIIATTTIFLVVIATAFCAMNLSTRYFEV